MCCPTEKGPSMIYLLLISLQDHVEAAAGLRCVRVGTAASLKALKHELEDRHERSASQELKHTSL